MSSSLRLCHYSTDAAVGADEDVEHFLGIQVMFTFLEAIGNWQNPCRRCQTLGHAQNGCPSTTPHYLHFKNKNPTVVDGKPDGGRDW
jgi:hypothetical protein